MLISEEVLLFEDGACCLVPFGLTILQHKEKDSGNYNGVRAKHIVQTVPRFAWNL